MISIFFSTLSNLFIILAIVISFYNDETTAIHSPLQYEAVEGSWTPESSEELRKGNLRYGIYFGSSSSGHPKGFESLKDVIESLTPSEKRDTLGYILKQRYREFRRKLEEPSEQEERLIPMQVPEELSNRSLQRKMEGGSIGPILTAATFQENGNSITNILKQLRSADESPSPIRSSSLRQEAHPFSVAPLQVTSMTTQSNSETVLEDRLGPSSTPRFDPSIVVDFHSLLQLTRRLQRLQKAESSKETGLRSQVLVQRKSRPNVRVFRRKLPDQSQRENRANKLEDQVAPKKQLSRAKVLQMPTNTNLNTTDDEELSMFISMGETEESYLNSQIGGVTKITNGFGPYSLGNDPEAGIHPSQVTVPDIDLMQLRLPQGVRDTLRNYLKPIISGLKPLRRNVPGLPGLDYPILSVVPYTNFYCSNMPWPGFYADTEARCQTWHACDVDGRQSTFLCPNGTVFNQALMVCDWWYNVDCLVTKYLYPLNERLFGTFKLEDTVQPHTRITPEVLDTIFIS